MERGIIEEIWQQEVCSAKLFCWFTRSLFLLSSEPFCKAGHHHTVPLQFNCAQCVGQGDRTRNPRNSRSFVHMQMVCQYFDPESFRIIERVDRKFFSRSNHIAGCALGCLRSTQHQRRVTQRWLLFPLSDPFLLLWFQGSQNIFGSQIIINNLIKGKKSKNKK